MKIGLKTFGCRANSVDTDALWAEARRRGYEVVADSEFADAYVINSCTVTSGADRDARSFARRLKRQNPKSVVAVVGCYGQVGRDELLEMDEVDLVLGTADKHRVFDLIPRTDITSADFVEETTGYLPEHFRGSRRSRASIKVQDGCNFRCSFCIIPQARGRSRSLPVEVVLNQIDEAYNQGFEEVVFTGVHLAHYGWDQNADLIQLLKLALKKENGPRIRLSTLDPFEIPDELISMIKNEERLCPYLHIALQSGSDRILSGMRRIYQANEFVVVTDKLHKADPDLFIGVDVIVGFPGEKEEDFLQTLACLNDSVWTKLHVFPYSSRKNTAAADFSDHVNKQEIESRSETLRKLSEDQYTRFLVSQIGKTKHTVLERPSAKTPNVWLGHTENYLPTLTTLHSGQIKQTVPVIVSQRMGERVWTEPLH